MGYSVRSHVAGVPRNSHQHRGVADCQAVDSAGGKIKTHRHAYDESRSTQDTVLQACRAVFKLSGCSLRYVGVPRYFHRHKGVADCQAVDSAGGKIKTHRHMSWHIVHQIGRWTRKMGLIVARGPSDGTICRQSKAVGGTCYEQPIAGQAGSGCFNRKPRLLRTAKTAFQDYQWHIIAPIPVFKRRLGNANRPRRPLQGHSSGQRKRSCAVTSSQKLRRYFTQGFGLDPVLSRKRKILLCNH